MEQHLRLVLEGALRADDLRREREAEAREARRAEVADELRAGLGEQRGTVPQLGGALREPRDVDALELGVPREIADELLQRVAADEGVCERDHQHELGEVFPRGEG